MKPKSFPAAIDEKFQFQLATLTKLKFVVLLPEETDDWFSEWCSPSVYKTRIIVASEISDVYQYLSNEKKNSSKANECQHAIWHIGEGSV